MYLYQCYVTGPWWLCDNPVTVVKDVNIPWNPDSKNITVSTTWKPDSKNIIDSAADTDSQMQAIMREQAWMSVQFFDAAGKDAGSVEINTKTGLFIGACSADWITTTTLPTETEKTWTITYNYTDKRLVLHCNGVQVLNVVLNSVCHYSASYWGTYWERKPTQIKFYSFFDSASDTYCFPSNPGKYNGVIDSGE